MKHSRWNRRWDLSLNPLSAETIMQIQKEWTTLISLDLTLHTNLQSKKIKVCQDQNTPLVEQVFMTWLYRRNNLLLKMTTNQRITRKNRVNFSGGKIMVQSIVSMVWILLEFRNVKKQIIWKEKALLCCWIDLLQKNQ